MKRTTLILLLFFTIAQPVWAKGYIRILERIPQGAYDFRLNLAGPHGATVSSMTEGADIAHNIVYHGCRGKRLFPVGRIVVQGKEKTVCPAPAGRTYIWKNKDGWLEDGPRPSADAQFIVGGFVQLMVNGNPILVWVSPPDTYRSRRERLILAFKGEDIFFVKGYGTLKEVALALVGYGFDSATNLDGGSSMHKNALVTAAIAGYRKKPTPIRKPEPQVEEKKPDDDPPKSPGVPEQGAPCSV